MITPKEAYDRFKEEYPDLEVTEAALYDKSSYLFIAPEGDNDMDDPFYLVNGSSGKVTPFSPITNFPKYTDAISNHQIYLDKLK